MIVMCMCRAIIAFHRDLIILTDCRRLITMTMMMMIDTTDGHDIIRRTP